MNPHRKELLLIGGRAQLGGDIHNYLAEVAKAEAAIGYIGFASTDDDWWREKLKLARDFYEPKGVKVVDVQTEEDCYGLGVVYMHGGWSRLLVDRLKETGIDKLLRQAWKAGDVVLVGSSAGAMALFWEMIDEDKDEKLSPRLVEGIGPMGGGFVVPHYDTWAPKDVVEQLRLEHPDKLIIGIDENTALRWRRGICDVVGVGKVTLLGRSSGVYSAGEEFDLGSTRS